MSVDSNTNLELININNNNIEEDIFEDDALFNLNETTALLQIDNNNQISVESRFELSKGILYAFVSALFFSLSSVIVKYLHRLSASELAIFRFSGIFLLSLPEITFNKHNPFGTRDLRYYLLISGASGGLSLLLRFYCIKYLPISEASVIIFSFPIIVTIFAKIFLKEPFGKFQIIIIFVTIIGLILVTRLPLINSENNNPVINSTININNTFIEQNSTSNQNYNRIIGISTGILSTVFVALNYIVLQKAKKAETNIVLFNLGWVALVELSLIALALKGYSLPSGSHEWSMIGLLMVCSYTGQCFATKSLRVEHCSPIAVIGAPIDILLGFVWQIALFSDEKIDAWSISGGLLVALCIILITFRKYIKSLPHNSKVKSMFNFMTK